MSNSAQAWRDTRLGDVLEEVDVRQRDYKEVPADELPVLSLTKNDGLILQSERFHHRVATDDVSDYKVVERDQIVYNPYVLWEGAVHALWKHPVGLVSPVYPVWRAVRADPYFLDCLLKSGPMMATYERVCSGVVKRRRSVSKTTFQNISATIPPFFEQRAVAAAIRAVQDARDAHRCEMDYERERKGALMEDLFTHGHRKDDSVRLTKYGFLPTRWAVKPLAECADVQTGAAKGRDFKGATVREVPYLRVANVQDGHLDLTEMKTLTIRESEMDRFRLRDGDVLLTEGGDSDKLGRGFVWSGQIADCIHQNHVFAVRGHPNMILPRFLAYLVASPYGKAYFLAVAHKTTNLACINTTKLKAFPVPLPPLDEQRDIAEVLTACDAKIAALEAEVALHDELFRAMLEELLSGRLSALALADGQDTGTNQGGTIG